MKERTLHIADQAQEDLLEIWLYIANDSSLAADRFLGLIHEKCRTLCEFPELGRNRDELLLGLRSLSVKRYTIYYRAGADLLEIVRILSGYRDVERFF